MNNHITEILGHASVCYECSHKRRQKERRCHGGGEREMPLGYFSSDFTAPAAPLLHPFISHVNNSQQSIHKCRLSGLQGTFGVCPGGLAV